MPPLYHIDDYDACLESPSIHLEAATYCVVFAEIAPNDTSALWHQISNFSAVSKLHFRHDYLFFGVCVERCRELLHPLSDLQKKQLYGGEAQNRVITEYYAAVHKRETDNRTRYEHEISSCLNYDFRRNYGLTLRTSIEYCEVANQPLKYDILDYIFSALIISLILLNALSSIYDFNLKKKQPLNMQNNKFYQTDAKSKVDSLLTSFSICRNYYRITQPLSGDIARDLRIFNTLRVFGTACVIFAHVFVASLTFQIENPNFIEKILHDAGFIQNGTAALNIFFIMSGMLLYLNIHKKIKPNSKLIDCFRVFMNLISNRFLRMLPCLIMYILFAATALTRLQDGPFWRHSTEAERVFCRENWWMNILFINNFQMNRSCGQHLWYIAADMQILVLCSLLLIIIGLYPKYKNALYITSTVILAVAVPAFVTYFLKLDGMFYLKPENFRYLFFKDNDTLHQLYAPFYTNISGYIFGIITADIYIQMKGKNMLHRYKGLLKYELAWWLFFPIITALLLTGSIFVWYDFERPSLWLAAYAGLFKNTWIFTCCLCILGMCLKIGWIAYEFCVMPMFEPLAKLTFQVYIWHPIVLRLLSYYRQPVYLNWFYTISTVILIYVLSNIIAFILAICLEFPFATVVKSLQSNSKGISAGKPVEDTTALQNLKVTT